MEENYVYEKKTILIVDDEQKIVDLLVHNLKKEGYNTIEANDGQTAIEIATEQRPNLILLDVMLPRLDGLTVCQKIKNIYNVPILMISAKDDELDKIVGLELGADDYITKPFSVREVVARVKANLRKVEVNIEEQVIAKKKQEENSKKKESVIKVGSLILDLEKYEVHIDGKVINLTLREFEVLKFLAQQPGQVVTRESLLERVWGYEYYGDIRTVDVWSEDYKREKEEKTQKAYESFKSNLYNKGVDISYDEYKDMVTQLGTIGEGVLGQLDYQSVLEQYSTAIKRGKKINLVEIFEHVNSIINSPNVNSKAYTTEDKIDMIVNEIRYRSQF